MKHRQTNNVRITAYTYDSVGNIIRVNSSYPMPQYQVTERYTYDSADQLLTAESTCNNNVLCSGAYSYNNWGKINIYTQQTTDPATNTSENKDYRYYFPGSSADMAQGQTSFAPIIKYDMQQNTQPLETCTYGINGSIRKRYDHQTQSTDYYYFNASGNLKACGTDMQISVYGYNSANTRTYKVNLFNANQWVNGQPQPIQPMVQSAMFYPNTYINFTQAGEYTKHYYNGTERISSRLGEQQIPISVENDQELEAYQHNVKEVIRNAIGLHLYDEPTDMQEGDVIPLEFLQATGDNNAVYYYHPNHLSSSMYVTDMQQSVVQSFLYAPYGDIISEYNTHVMGEAFPKYAFNAKELDEETGFYYYEARYYAPPVFTSRDAMFEKYFWMSPYAYCANNPVKYVDPDGKEIGKIYNLNGQQIGDDGKNDNIVYLYTIYDNIQLTKEDAEFYIMHGFVRNITKETGLTNDELNLRASLSTLKQAEAGRNNPPLDYNSWNGNDKFTNYTYEEHPDDYKSHPGKNNTTNRTSAGAYQFLEKYYSQKDFSPKSQDMAAVKLMTTKGYDAALSGDMNNFKLYNMGRWTSLEHWSVENLQQKFNKYRADELLGGSNIAAPIGSLLRK